MQTPEGVVGLAVGGGPCGANGTPGPTPTTTKTVWNGQASDEDHSRVPRGPGEGPTGPSAFSCGPVARGLPYPRSEGVCAQRMGTPSAWTPNRKGRTNVHREHPSVLRLDRCAGAEGVAVALCSCQRGPLAV